MELMIPDSLNFMKPAIKDKKLGLIFLQALSIFQQVRDESRKRGLIDGTLSGCKAVALTKRNELIVITDENGIIMIPRPVGNESLPARLAITVGKIYDQLDALIKVESSDEVIIKFMNGVLIPSPSEAVKPANVKEKEKEQ